MLSIKLWKSSQRSELLKRLSGPCDYFLFPICQTWKATSKPLSSAPQRVFPVGRKTGVPRAPITHLVLLVWFSISSSVFLHLVQRCCVYCLLFILQVWPRGHLSLLSLSLQVESHSLLQVLRTCTEWRKSSGAPATPSPSLSPATLTTASRTQYSRDQLGRVLSTMSGSLFTTP